MAEREVYLIFETALGGLIPTYTIHFFIGSSCQIRDVTYIGLRIVVIYEVDGRGF